MNCRGSRGNARPYSCPVTTDGHRAVARLILATVGAVVSVLTVYAGNQPGPLLTTLAGTSVSSVVVFAGLLAAGLWVLRTASASAWRWAVGIGVVLASAQLLGLLLRRILGGNRGGMSTLLAPANLPWFVVHWLGITWMVSCALAALIYLLDTRTLRWDPDSPDPNALAKGKGRPGSLARLMVALRSPDRGPRGKALLVVMGILVLSRIPYLAVYWPGIVAFDTFRSYAYARGISAWDTYDPFGHSLLIAVMQWLGTSLGWGDAGGVAIGAATVILASSAAFTFMLSRMAVWGLRSGIWVGALAWLALLPVFGYYSVQLVKDVPFSIAMVVFLSCIGELVFGRPETAKRLWPWVTLAIAGIFALLMRNNGIHTMALTLPLLLLPLRHFWKRILIVSAAIVAAYALYVGPGYSTLNVQPGPKEESYSVPLQQLGLVARRHGNELSAADREFMVRTFSGKPPEQFARSYVPWLADPMKLAARKAWGDQTTGEFLSGWVGIIAQYPVTAIGATLANTVGYWDPEGPSYDGINRWSANDVRTIHLDIPSGKPTTGIAGKIESSGIMPTKTYRAGLHDDGYRAIPVVGLAMSPGPICWVWLISALLVIRRRDWKALGVFVPAGVMLLTFLAGPVSGGQRYTLPLFMTLPLAIAAVALAARTGGEGLSPGRTAIEKPMDQSEPDGTRTIQLTDLRRRRPPVRTGSSVRRAGGLLGSSGGPTTQSVEPNASPNT